MYNRVITKKINIFFWEEAKMKEEIRVILIAYVIVPAILCTICIIRNYKK